MTTKTASTKRPTPSQPNFYSLALNAGERRLLARARRYKGLRTETALMRVLLLRFVKSGDFDNALKVTTTLARLEEGDSRIASRKGDPEEEIESGRASVEQLLVDLYPSLGGAE